ncbi:hypothetical protein H7F10_12355 [Acidithiobacillus sp. HP-6]|uniref:nitric oxide reductase activation protein NorD n=1 Tax=unclassified Acidithiobacillus TaxID=2614800 RepID=UPI0018798C6A|nr:MULTISPECIES: hypothetical protein [unclassified Acidithiobacillus]MBE7563724.1 hypothetical protein [Acidithiobacillus sp. HP-6]MBE7569493.1 hypothetical protein [Acidithiobacillus sp. HP-2]
MPPSTDAETGSAIPPDEDYWRRHLDCAFSSVQAVFADCFTIAGAQWQEQELFAYVDAARFLCKLGRGAEPVMAFLEGWPEVVAAAGHDCIDPVLQWVAKIQRSPNGDVIGLFFQTLPAVTRALPNQTLLRDYLDLLTDIAERSSTSIHGRHAILPSRALPEFIRLAAELLQKVNLEGLQTWAEYGLRYYASNPERQADYFALQSADSRAIFQEQRDGTLLRTHEREMDLYLRALWDEPAMLVPYSEAFDHLRRPQPYLDSLGMHLPDLYHDREGISGLDQYRLALAHLAAHRRYSQALLADNWSPFQRLYIEYFEDARVDTLILRRFPGLRALMLQLHPHPQEEACDSGQESCVRHRLTLFSRAILDPEHGYQNPVLRQFVQRFHEQMLNSSGSTRSIAELALEYLIQTRLPSDSFARVHFTDTEVSYRDDNRHLWQFIDGDQESEEESSRAEAVSENELTLVRHYPEWDYRSQHYLPDWVSLYEHLHPQGSASDILQILQKHAALAKRLERLLDMLKPQDRERLRRQEEGSDLDLDWALRSWVDYRCRQNVDPRINESFRHARRNLSVSLLLDLSESLNDPVEGTGSGPTILSLAQEAVTLLAWAIDRLGDPFAISGFYSNTRHELRYWHIKGFSEPWQDAVYARLAALRAAYSTRMGAALRHAGHYLSGQSADKRLLLILTDGQPADIDVDDPDYLLADTRRAVLELEEKGIFCHCISLDPHADEYVRKIFGNRFSIIDRVESLPERLPEIFLSLTR